MKNFSELELGFNDAKDYKNGDYNKMLAEIFVKNQSLKDIIKRNTYFLVGDKGTGKTAYAVYLSNNKYENIRSRVVDVAETDIRDFIQLKKMGQIQISDYTRIWKIILLWNVCDFLESKDIKGFIKKRKKYDEVKSAIKDYKENAFIPEILSMYKSLQRNTDSGGGSVNISKASLELNSKYENSSELERKDYQNKLVTLEKTLSSIFKGLNMQNSLFIFIDSLDAALEGVEKEDYKNCLEGLAKAVLSVNQEVFQNMPANNAIIKIIENFRSDLFNDIPLHNKGSISKDNTVFLSWQINNNSDYKRSDLFLLCNKILAYNNNFADINEAWNKYFPWKNSFKECVDLSMQRPRDMISIMKEIQETHKISGKGEISASKKDLINQSTQNNIGTYYIEEARDWSLVKITPPEVFDTIKFFFECINSKSQFTYLEYMRFHKKFIEECSNREFIIVEDFKNKDKFLQLLFELNFICYTERAGRSGELFTYWCSRERSRGNQSPKIHLNAQYKVHSALKKPFNLGQTTISSRINNQ
jgi:archaellum biogenesis ATPase FlaH